MAVTKKLLQHKALQLVFWQFIVTMVLSLIILFLASFSKALSAFLGGSAYLIPQFLFAWIVFHFAQLRSAGKFMAYFLIGEFLKLIIGAVLFILLIKNFSVNLMFTLLGYMTAIVSFWFVSGWCLGRKGSLEAGVSA